jgi:hypothetical protein
MRSDAGPGVGGPRMETSGVLHVQGVAYGCLVQIWLLARLVSLPVYPACAR